MLKARVVQTGQRTKKMSYDATMIRLCNGKLCLRVVIKDLHNQKCGLRVKQWLQFRTLKKKLVLKSVRIKSVGKKP